MKKFDYESKEYLKKLNELPETYYSKYITFIKRYLKRKDSSFLDIGCGNGKVLNLLLKQGYRNGYGAEISKLFVKEANEKGLRKVFYYDGIKFPFKENYFDLIGSFNVLEHVDNPENFLSSQVKLLKKNGYIIVACPNFLSATFMSNHRRLKGIRRKVNNATIILSKIISPKNSFEIMEPVIRQKFEYDDDAIVVTNLLDLKRVLKNNKCRVVYESGFINYDSTMFRIINSIPFMKYLLPSCFLVAKKNK